MSVVLVGMLFLASSNFPYSDMPPKSNITEIPVYKVYDLDEPGYEPDSCDRLADRLTTDNPDKGWNIYACVDVRKGGGPIVWKKKLKGKITYTQDKIVELKK